ncbi:MAG: hypothetical protein AAFX09_08225 [Pseudomonadota bacterium]
MSVARYLFHDGRHSLVLEVGRLADISPNNEIWHFMQGKFKDERPELADIDLEMCLVRRISFAADRSTAHCENGPAFQIEHAITGEVYVSEYIFEGRLFDPNDPNSSDYPDYLRQKAADALGLAPSV